MALIDELTQRITAELHRTLDQAIRQAVESYVVGDGRQGRRTKPTQPREKRSRTIIDAVMKLGEASVEDVARVTGLDKRGVGSSLHYLAAAGKLKHARAGKYKVSRMARAA